jgi:methylmalonyl-CoA mutase cobalamin-binding subunit
MTPATAPAIEASRPPERVRVVTAASLFDGHDAAINIMRRILQAQGAEVIHLGHDRSVEEIAMAAVQEDAHAVAVSSYQGGHMEFFRFLLERLRGSTAAGAEPSPRRRPRRSTPAGWRASSRPKTAVRWGSRA